MLSERTDQRGLWSADLLYLDYAWRDTFRGRLASLRRNRYRAAAFAKLYCPDNRLISVPPRPKREPASTFVGRWP